MYSNFYRTNLGRQDAIAYKDKLCSIYSKTFPSRTPWVPNESRLDLLDTTKAQKTYIISTPTRSYQHQ